MLSEHESASLFWKECCVFSLEILSRAITGSWGSCINFFPEPPWHLSQLLHQFPFPPTVHRVPLCTRLWPHWCLSLGQSPFQQLWGDSWLQLWLLFPWRRWVMLSNFFSVCWPLCAIFGKYLFTNSPHLSCSFSFWFVWVFCVFWILSSSHTKDLQMFLLIGEVVFEGFDCCFCHAENSVCFPSPSLFLLLVSDVKEVFTRTNI